MTSLANIEAQVKAIAPAIRRSVAEAVKAAVSAIEIPAGERGADGVSVTVDDLRPVVNEAVARSVSEAVSAIEIPAGERGADGVSVTVDDLRPVVDEAVARSVSEAVKSSISYLDEKISLSLKAFDEALMVKVATLPVPRDAFQVEDFDLSLGEDGRTVCVSMKRGDSLVEKFVTMPVILDKGVYNETKEYAAGDAVSYGGSLFIAQKDSPEGRPADGGDNWRLAVKRGRDGKSVVKVGS